jgi:hypothetical protein
MTGVKHWLFGSYVIGWVEKVPFSELSECKSMYLVPGINAVPVIVTETRDPGPSEAAPETKIWGVVGGSPELTVHCMVGALDRVLLAIVRSPTIVSV